MNRTLNDPIQIEVLYGDITKVQADIIVNAANPGLLGGGGVDGAIHRAGGKSILEECIQIRDRDGGCPTGHAVITTAGNLPAKYVIHTVGPVWNGGERQEEELLASCYQNSIRLAEERGAASLVFPNISTGIYHFPKPLAAKVALDAVRAEAERVINGPHSLQKILFVCFDRENYELYKALLAEEPLPQS